MHTSDLITRFFDQVPEEKRSITIHQLLTHTSGVVRDVPIRAETRDAVVGQVLAKPLRFAPGATFAYSNAGYKLLAAIVEVASGEPFDVFVRRELFTAAGLVDTGFYEDAAWQDCPVARSYFETADYGVPTEWKRTWGTFGSGHVISNVSDSCDGSVIFDKAASSQHRPSGSCSSLRCPPMTWAPMHTVGTSRTPAAGDSIYHDGDYSGFSTDLRRYEASNAVLVIATNEGYVDGLGLKRAFIQPLTDLLLGRDVSMPPQAMSLTDANVSTFVGTFRLPTGADFAVQARSGVLRIEPRGQEAFSVLHHPDAETFPDYSSLNDAASVVMRATSEGGFDTIEHGVTTKSTPG